MRALQIWILAALAALIGLAALGCEGADGTANGSDGDSDSDSDSDTDSDTDSDSDSDADTDSDTDPGFFTDLHGTVLSPALNVPIPGALVYITGSDAPEIPDEAYCYECEDMTGKKWTLSAADGTWDIEDVPAGQTNIVTRKGFFQRQRAIEVTGEPDQDIPQELTTLPGADSDDGLDQIPQYAVLLNYWDQQHNLLAKFGLGEVDGTGNLIFGTEQFDIYNDALQQPSYPQSTELFVSQEWLNQYHMSFFPCYSNWNAVSYVVGLASMFHEYVMTGGKVYNSCCTALWTESPFPDYIDFYGDDNPDQFDIGRISGSAYSTTGEVMNEDMAAWLEVVTTVSTASFPFTDGYVKIDAITDVYDGHGLEEDDGWVKPYAWVVDNGSYPGSPLIVTYAWECGKIFYSVYETSHQEITTFTPQEYVLLYVILEVGVCEGEYIPPE